MSRTLVRSLLYVCFYSEAVILYVVLGVRAYFVAFPEQPSVTVNNISEQYISRYEGGAGKMLL
jgi:hypothetical protein